MISKLKKSIKIDYEKSNSAYQKVPMARAVIKEEVTCRTEINTKLILSYIREKESLEYILDFKHFDFYVNLFRKYFKVFNPTTHDRDTMLEVQSIMGLFSDNILNEKRLCNDVRKKIKIFINFEIKSMIVLNQILFSNWKFLLKNFKFFCSELENNTGFNCLSYIHKQFIYLSSENIARLYKAMFHYCEK